MATHSIFDEKALNVVVDVDNCITDYLKLKTKSRYIYGGGKIECYNRPETFLENLNRFPASTNFFFGCFFGPRAKLEGIDLAKAVKDRNKNSPVIIVTTVSEDHFTDALKKRIVDIVFPKEIYFTEPHDNGQLTDEENKEFFSFVKTASYSFDWQDISRFSFEHREPCLEKLKQIKNVLEMVALEPLVTFSSKGLKHIDSPHNGAQEDQSPGYWDRVLKFIGIQNVS